MKLHSSWRIRLAQILLGSAIVIALLIARGSRAQGPGNDPVHLPTDWSHRHAVFSRPSSIWNAWQLQKEPRYWHQNLRQHAWAFRPADSGSRRRDRDNDGAVDMPGQDQDPLHRDRGMSRDWAMSLGAGALGTAGQYPAKFSFSITAAPDCTNDYVAFTTRLTGRGIVAFDNLYSTQPGVGGFCNTAGPSVKWAYDTRIAGDTTGTTPTSPTLSLDGAKIAYVETRTNANGGSILHILKWKPGAGTTIQGTIAAPAAPDTILAPGANWSTCPAANSCVSNIVFNGAPQDTNSPPFYNFANDTLYAGDDVGRLHKFTGVFNGAPAEVTTAPWPINVNGASLTGPVHDFGSGNIFVGDNTGQLSYIREVGSTVGACAAGSPPCLGLVSAALGGAIVDPPIVDGSTGRVIVFDGTDANNGSVYQFDTSLTPGSQVTVNVRGTGGGGAALYAGTFDDAYFSLGPGSGHFYTCGKDPALSNAPAIFRLSFNGSGVLSAAPGTPLVNLTSGDSACSPVTELKNGATDQLFFSVETSARPPGDGGNATGCINNLGCVISIAIPATWPPAATTAGAFASGGTSGIVIDNVGGGAQQSNIYFTWLANSTAANQCNGTTGVGCAVKLTQSGLN